MTAFRHETLRQKDFINPVFLTRADLQKDMSARGQMAFGRVGNPAVGLQSVRPPVKRPCRIKATDIRGQTGNLPQRNIGWILNNEIIAPLHPGKPVRLDKTGTAGHAQGQRVILRHLQRRR